jgi:hypothetical protein
MRIAKSHEILKLQKFGTWNVRSFYRVGFLMTVSRELSEYKLDLMECRAYNRVMALNKQKNTHFLKER